MGDAWRKAQIEDVVRMFEDAADSGARVSVEDGGRHVRMVYDEDPEAESLEQQQAEAEQAFFLHNTVNPYLARFTGWTETEEKRGILLEAYRRFEEREAETGGNEGLTSEGGFGMGYRLAAKRGELAETVSDAVWQDAISLASRHGYSVPHMRLSKAHDSLELSDEEARSMEAAIGRGMGETFEVRSEGDVLDRRTARCIRDVLLGGGVVLSRTPPRTAGDP